MPGKYTKEKRISVLKNKLNLTEEFEKEYDLIFDYLTDEEIIKYNNLIMSIRDGDCDKLFERFKTYLEEFPKIGYKAITERRMLLKYGDKIGKEKWNEYREKQKITNTFEYKKDKFGYTLEDFKKYNNSRSVTEENLIRRHGEKIGKEKWNEYREKQTFVGCKIEYFIEKYGEEDGIEMYNNLCNKKGLTKNNFIRKYGYELGLEKYKNYWDNRHVVFYSEISQVLFEEIEKILIDNNINTDHIYYNNKNKEFGLMDDDHYYKYDFVDTYNKVAIEFNGDYWHANPNKYKPNDNIRNSKAVNIWEKDNKKLNLIVNEGYNVIIIWESDFNLNRNETIKRALNELYRI